MYSVSASFGSIVGCFAMVVSSVVIASDGGISVSGTGKAIGKPDQLSVKFEISGAAELTGDAIVKFYDSTRRGLAAMNDLGIEDLEIETGALSVADASSSNNRQMMMMNGNAQNMSKSKAKVSRTYQARVSNIGKLSEKKLIALIGRILDTAKDAGISVDQSKQLPGYMIAMSGMSQKSLVTFVLTNSADLREQAYQDAFKKARNKAERLAKLAGVRLGPVLSVTEGSVQEKSVDMQQYMIRSVYGMSEDPKQMNESFVTTNKFQPIHVLVTLHIRFSILDGSENTEMKTP